MIMRTVQSPPIPLGAPRDRATVPGTATERQTERTPYTIAPRRRLAIGVTTALFVVAVIAAHVLLTLRLDAAAQEVSETLAVTQVAATSVGAKQSVYRITIEARNETDRSVLASVRAYDIEIDGVRSSASQLVTDVETIPPGAVYVEEIPVVLTSNELGWLESQGEVLVRVTGMSRVSAGALWVNRTAQQEFSVTRVVEFEAPMAAPVPEAMALSTALDLVRSDPLYSLGGAVGSLELVETVYPDCVGCIEFLVRFRSAYPAYGADAEPVAVTHVAHLTLSHGEVATATLDDRFDMLTQTLLPHLSR